MDTLRSFLFLGALFFIFPGFAQEGTAQENKSKDVFAPPYNRIGLTPILLKPDSVGYDHSLERAFEKVEIPDKFDDNQIHHPYLGVYLPGALKDDEEESSVRNGGGNEGAGETDEEELGSMAFNLAKEGIESKVSTAVASNLNNPLYDSIVRARLKRTNVTHRVIDSLYSADEEGRYSMDLLLKRAKYNLTDAQATRLEATAKGLEGSVQDMKWANKILTSNYILGFYFHELKTMDEYYAEAGISEDAQTHVGYKGKVSAYLFRIDMNDSVRAVFYDKCWAGDDASEEELAAAREARKKMDYPLELVGSYRFPVDSKRFGDDASSSEMEELFAELGSQAVKTGTKAIEKKVDAFKVRSSLYDYRAFPFPYAWSKIGTKQGLEPDDRYFVYEYVAGDSGEVKKKRRGVLRASSDIAVNDTGVGTSEPTKFIQTAGWGLGKGMLIEQNADAGIDLSIGYIGHGDGTHFLNARLGLRISKMLNASPAWYVYGEAGIHYPSEPEDVERLSVVQEGDTNSYEVGMRTTGLGVGVSKEFYFLNHFQIAPYFGLRREKTRFSSDSLHSSLTEAWEGYGTVWTVDAGARLGVNITYWMKLTGSLGVSPVIYSDDGTLFGEKTPENIGDEGSDISIPSLGSGEPNPFHQGPRFVKWEMALRFLF